MESSQKGLKILRDKKDDPSHFADPVRRVLYQDVREKVPRDFQIRWEDAREYGATPNCPSCRSWSVGLARQPHRKHCKDWFRRLLQNDARYLDFFVGHD